MNKLLGTDLRHIPYRGSAPGIQDLLGGQISAMSSRSVIPSYLKSGKLRLLAISGINRSLLSRMCNLSPARDSITCASGTAFFLPGKASPQTVRRAAAYMQTALAQPDLISSMAQVGDGSWVIVRRKFWLTSKADAENGAAL